MVVVVVVRRSGGGEKVLMKDARDWEGDDRVKE